jgi:hypothetical protein
LVVPAVSTLRKLPLAEPNVAQHPLVQMIDPRWPPPDLAQEPRQPISKTCAFPARRYCFQRPGHRQTSFDFVLECTERPAATVICLTVRSPENCQKA